VREDAGVSRGRRRTAHLFLLLVMTAASACSDDGGAAPGSAPASGPGSSGPSARVSSPTPSAAPAAPRGRPSSSDSCTAAGIERADLDGDGRLDVAYQRFRPQPYSDVRLGICLASGARDEISVGGMGEVFGVTDIQDDGRFEVLSGGNSVSTRFTNIYVVHQGRLREVMSGGRPLLLTTGGDRFASKQYGQWGCEDVAAPPGRELLQARLDYGTARMTTRLYSLRGSTAVLLRAWTSPLPASWSKPEKEGKPLTPDC
jgi:hypothetical protein